MQELHSDVNEGKSFKDLGITVSSQNAYSENPTINEIYDRFCVERSYKIPEYQRDAGCWNERKMELLIDSIIRKQRIQSITLSNKGNDTFNIVDGLQRLETIRRFIENTFPVPMKIGDTIYKYYFKFLPPNLKGKEKSISRTFDPIDQKLFLKSTINIIIYINLSDEEERQLFSRIQNSVPLTPSQRINFKAYETSFPNIYSYIVNIANKLRNAQWFGSIIKLKIEGQQNTTKYNSLVATLLLNAVYEKSNNLKKTKLKSTSLTGHHYNDLENPSTLEFLKTLFGDNGEHFLQKLEELSIILRKENRYLTSGELIQLVNSYFYGGVPIKDALEELATLREIANKNQS